MRVGVGVHFKHQVITIPADGNCQRRHGFCPETFQFIQRTGSGVEKRASSINLLNE